MQLYIDKCIPQGEIIACVAVCITPLHEQLHAVFGGTLAVKPVIYIN